MTALLECTCDLAYDGDDVTIELLNPLCPAHGDQRDTSVDALSADSLAKLPLEELWDFREAMAAEIRRTQERKGRIEQEFVRRALEARPDFGPDSGGTVEVVGETLVLAVGYSRDYAYDAEKVVEVQRFLTPDEYDRFVKFEAKVNGTVFNSLLKRGGELAALLTGARSIKGTPRPTFTPKGRA